MITGTVDMLRSLTNELSTSGTYSDSKMVQYLTIAGSDLYGAGFLIWTEKIAALKGAADDYSHYMQKVCASNRGAQAHQFIKDPPETESDDLQ